MLDEDHRDTYASDATLMRLADPLEVALKHQKPVIALGLWNETPFCSFLPFDLHLRKPNLIRSLPLNASWGYLPFLETATSDVSRYRISEALDARRKARIARHNDNAAFPGDLTPPDWEQGSERALSMEIGERMLAGASFLSVDVVNPRTGEIRRGSRPVLGRHAKRSAHRPQVLILGRGTADPSVLDKFQNVDILIVDIQRLRGPRSIASIREILQHRGTTNATLIVAAGPLDLYYSDLSRHFLEQCEIFCIGVEPPFREAIAVAVNDLRQLDQAMIDFATATELTAEPMLVQLAWLAKRAWWAVRNSLSDEVDSDPAALRFVRALDEATVENPRLAAHMRHAKDLIAAASLDRDRIQERRNAVVRQVLTASGDGAIAVLTSGWKSSEALKRALCKSLEISTSELRELGVDIHTVWDLHIPVSQTVVVAGFFGRDTIDAALKASPEVIRFVLDPVEARAGWSTARDLLELCSNLGLPSAQRPLEGVQQALGRIAASVGQLNEVDALFDVNCEPHGTRADKPPEHWFRGLTGETIVSLTTGEELVIPSESPMFVLAHAGERGERKRARELESGDAIVLIRGPRVAAFAEALLDSLDRGPLKSLVEQRNLWFTIVQSVMREGRFQVSELHDTLYSRGVNVDRNSVRSWTKFDKVAEGIIPRHLDTFLALAAALEIRLPREQLTAIFQANKRWRVLHRKAGRDLARAVRLAGVRRLGANTQARVRKDWGLEIAELIGASRIAVVDTVETMKDM